jgi:hypothetical protein
LNRSADTNVPAFIVAAIMPLLATAGILFLIRTGEEAKVGLNPF